MSVGLIDLYDMYAYLAMVSGARDAEMPLVAPTNLHLDPGKMVTIDLMANFRFARQEDGATIWDIEEERRWPPRPIFTKNDNHFPV